MTDLLKKLHAELEALFSAEDEAPPKKKKVVEEDEDEDEITEKVVKNKKAKDIEEEVDEDEDDETPKKKGKPTMAQVKAKLKEVLDTKGRDAAVALLEKFEAEKIGEIDEENWGEFLFQAQRVIEKKGKDSNIKKKVKTEDEEDDE
jgi:hypothetical protein